MFHKITGQLPDKMLKCFIGETEYCGSVCCTGKKQEGSVDANRVGQGEGHHALPNF